MSACQHAAVPRFALLNWLLRFHSGYHKWVCPEAFLQFFFYFNFLTTPLLFQVAELLVANPHPCQGVAGCCEQILGDVSMKFGTCSLVATASKILPVLCVWPMASKSSSAPLEAEWRQRIKDRRCSSQAGNITSLHSTANSDKTILSLKKSACTKEVDNYYYCCPSFHFNILLVSYYWPSKWTTNR